MNNDIQNQQTISFWLVLLLATACGLTAANLYYAQPLAGPIGADLGLSGQATGLIVTLTQIGYGLGLLLIVPLGDIVENRLLALVMFGICAASLAGAALAPDVSAFFLAAFFIGFGSVAVQVLVPYAAHLAPEASRGRVVGNVVSGLLLGIMLARPVSSFIADHLSWRGVFYLSSAGMVLLAAILRLALPRRVPTGGMHYGALLSSMITLTAATPILRRRALYHGLLGAAFSLFWTTSPFLLSSAAYGLSQSDIALFALAGVAGAVAAPIAGRLADAGWLKTTTVVALSLVAFGFIITRLAQQGSSLGLGLLVTSAIVIDFGVTANMTVGQRLLFSLGHHIRGRLNSLYMAAFFAGGAVGSAFGGWAYAQGGWPYVSWLGLAFPIMGLIFFTSGMVERRDELKTRA